MAKLRKIKEYLTEDSRYKYTVLRDAEWDEYRVRHYIWRQNKYDYNVEQDYHTSDKEDAISHAKAIRDRAEMIG
jgi:hypothetical protein